jgi:hypothetical protein
MFDSLNFSKLKTSDAPRRAVALLLALTTALGGTGNGGSNRTNRRARLRRFKTCCEGS